MIEDDSSEARRALAHDARQSLNAIRLTAGNVRLRLSALLGDEDREWLHAKLAKIDRQVEQLSGLLDRQG